MSGRRELSVKIPHLSVKLPHLSRPNMDELETLEKTENLLYEIFFLLE